MNDHYTPGESHPPSDPATPKDTAPELSKGMDAILKLCDQIEKGMLEKMEILEKKHAGTAADLLHLQQQLEKDHKHQFDMLEAAMKDEETGDVPAAFKLLMAKVEKGVHSLGADLKDVSDELGEVQKFNNDMLRRMNRLETFLSVSHQLPWGGNIGEGMDPAFLGSKVQEEAAERQDPGMQIQPEMPIDSDSVFYHFDENGLHGVDPAGNIVVLSESEKALAVRTPHEQAQTIARGVGAAISTSVAPIQASMQYLASLQNTARKEMRTVSTDVTLLIDEQTKISSDLIMKAEAMSDSALKMQERIEKKMDLLVKQGSLVDMETPEVDTETVTQEPEGGPSDADDGTSEEGDRGSPIG